MTNFEAPDSGLPVSGAGSSTIAATDTSAGDGYDAAMDAAMNAPTAYARARAVEQLERIAISRAAETSPASDGAPPVFEPPVTALAYDLATPMGLEPMSEVQTGEVRAALFSEGVPREFVAQGYSNLAHLERSGALASDASFEEACRQCRTSVEKTYGAGAQALIRDGIAFLEALAKKHPVLDAAATAALADPFLLSNAANLQRQRSRQQ